jgi:fumarate reductase flavoprotein subunit
VELRTADVVVVGAGLAGLTAAVTVAEAGGSVVVLEKLERPGGSTAMSGGWFSFSGTPRQRADGVDDDAAAYLVDLEAVAEGRADPALLDVLVGQQQDAWDFLVATGAAQGALTTSAGMSRPRSHQFDIDHVLDGLVSRLLAAGGELRTGSAARDLVLTGDRVTGVHLDQDALLGARRGVLLATGGFSRSTRLLEIFAPAQLAAIPYGGPGNTGDGLLMAWRLGAGMRDLGYVSGTFGSHPDTTDDEHELLTAFYLGAIIVNSRGERFADESADYKALGTACLQQPDGLGFEIFDERVMARSKPGVPLSDIGHLDRKGRILHADDLPSLARAAGIDPDGLVATVAAYNAGIALGVDAFGRTGRVNGVGALDPLDLPPFHAYPAKTLMTSTYAGLTIDPRGIVLRVDGSPIVGLFAAGEITGGFHGPGYMTGSALSKALVFGRVVGRQLARREGGP